MPGWARSLIWTDELKSYDAFLSYSWAADRQIAPIIQSVLQGFLRPWYKIRALNIFRDLSSLAANSSLEKALREKIDKSRHFIVLAPPEARGSDGMEFEAKYWFSRPRSGDILVVLTDGKYSNWPEIRDSALPATLRDRLQSPLGALNGFRFSRTARCLGHRSQTQRGGTGAQSFRSYAPWKILFISGPSTS